MKGRHCSAQLWILGASQQIILLGCFSALPHQYSSSVVDLRCQGNEVQYLLFQIVGFYIIYRDSLFIPSSYIIINTFYYHSPYPIFLSILLTLQTNSSWCRDELCQWHIQVCDWDIRILDIPGDLANMSSVFTITKSYFYLSNY